MLVAEFSDYEQTLVHYASADYRHTHELLSNAAMIDLVLLRGIGAEEP